MGPPAQSWAVGVDSWVAVGVDNSTMKELLGARICRRFSPRFSIATNADVPSSSGGSFVLAEYLRSARVVSACLEHRMVILTNVLVGHVVAPSVLPAVP